MEDRLRGRAEAERTEGGGGTVGGPTEGGEVEPEEGEGPWGWGRSASGAEAEAEADGAARRMVTGLAMGAGGAGGYMVEEEEK